MDRIFGLATEYWIRPPPRTYPQTGLFSRLLVASRGSGCPSTYYYIHYVAELPGCALLTYMQGWEPGKMDIVFGFPTQKLPRCRPPLCGCTSRVGVHVFALKWCRAKASADPGRLHGYQHTRDIVTSTIGGFGFTVHSCGSGWRLRVRLNRLQV